MPVPRRSATRLPAVKRVLPGRGADQHNPWTLGPAARQGLMALRHPAGRDAAGGPAGAPAGASGASCQPVRARFNHAATEALKTQARCISDWVAAVESGDHQLRQVLPQLVGGATFRALGCATRMALEPKAWPDFPRKPRKQRKNWKQGATEQLHGQCSCLATSCFTYCSLTTPCLWLPLARAR
jgi:hypothetical protein